MSAPAAFRRIVVLLSGSDQTLYADDIQKVESALHDAAAHDLAEALDPEELEAIADEIGEEFKHSARAYSLRIIAKKQRAALAKARGEE